MDHAKKEARNARRRQNYAINKRKLNEISDSLAAREQRREKTKRSREKQTIRKEKEL